MKCQNCGANLENGVSFCRECGSKVIRKTFCRDCGQEVAAGAKFCSNCGADMTIVDKFASKVVNNNPEPNKTNTQSVRSNSNNSVNTNKSAQRNTSTKRTANIDLGQYRKKQAKSNNSIMLVAIVAVVVILFIGLFSLLSSKKNSAENSMNLIPTFTSTQTSDFTIDLGTQYAYMSDEWNVYIAEAVTDSVIKIERWNKGSSSDKKVKLRDEIGSFKINDEENGFAWIDDDHTAFTFKFKDKNNSSRVKGQTVVFTININNSDENKGSDYDERIACYSYQNDDWHNYRAIPLTDDLMKIEVWYRGSSAGKFLFGYDMCVLNMKSSDTDFEMNSDKSAFTITIVDPANHSYWKEKTFVSFTLENPNYQYPDVWSYRDAFFPHAGEIAVSTDASTYKYKDYNEVQSALEEEGFTNISTSILYDIVWGITPEGEVDSVSIDGNNSFKSGDIFSTDAPVVITYHMKYEDNPEENSTNTDANESIKDKEDVKDAFKDGLEEAETAESNNEDYNKEETNAENSNSDMPVMSGTSLKDAASVAKQYGVVEKYDDDFGHGTRCKAFCDSAGGLMLDVIYVEATNEIMSASITTNKLASSNDQKAFVKAMAAVLCPQDDSSDVSSWVSSNVGGSKSTTIGGFTYEVDLGPVQNVLFYAGNKEWEDWESQYW